MEDLTLDPDAADAPFEQLRRQVAAQVADGRLQPGERLPTVRALAASVGVAVNTAARVYTELESDGVVVTEGRRGTFVRAPAAPAAVREAALALAAAARRAGLGRTEALRLLEDAW